MSNHSVKYPHKKTGGAVKLRRILVLFAPGAYFFLAVRASAIAACAAASRAIGTRNGLQET